VILNELGTLAYLRIKTPSGFEHVIIMLHVASTSPYTLVAATRLGPPLQQLEYAILKW
jgi:hypothetical protein